MFRSSVPLALLLLASLCLVGLSSQDKDKSEPVVPQIPSNCPSLGGVYELNGRALEGYPTFYRVRAWPLSMDRMLGVPISDDKRQHVTKVQLIQGTTLECIALGDNGPIDRRVVIRPGDQILCESDTLRLDQSMEVSGDGEHSNLQITHMISVMSPRGIQIITRIRGTTRFLFLFNPKIPPKDYAAVFSRSP